MTEIETARLRVRPFRPSDWRDLFVYLSEPDIYEFEPGEPVDPERARVMAEERSRGRAFWAVELKDERRMVGHLYFAPVDPPELRTGELGYIFGPRDQRRGYATEAARALIDHAFATLGTHRVIAHCHPENVASWRVLEKLAFVREGHLRRNVFFRVDGEGRPLWQDTLVYALLSPLEDGPGRGPTVSRR